MLVRAVSGIDLTEHGQLNADRLQALYSPLVPQFWQCAECDETQTVAIFAASHIASI